MEKSITQLKKSLSLPGKITSVGWDIPKTLSFDDWQQCGNFLAQLERSAMWWIGDWWRYGEHKYGDRAAAVADADTSFQTCADAGWVAGKIETSRRREVVAWSIHREVAVLEPDEQDRILDKAEAEGLTVRDVRGLVRMAKSSRIARENKELQKGKYRILYADPPWLYGNERPDYVSDQGDHYPEMSIDDICNLPVDELAEDNAVLFLWVTSPILRESFDVIDAWGFEYKTSFVWDKIKHNMGHYNSVRHELLLVCVKGSCTPDNRKLFDSVQTIERTAHSEKPEIFREIIDTIYPHGKRIELFARKAPAKNWRVWGNE